MKKIDWYILKKFLTTFFFSIFLFTVIAVIVDVSEKTDDFVKSKLGFSKIVTEYYLGFVPFIVAMLFPLFVFIAVIFFTSKMANRSEIIAIFASGTRYGRWLRPYWVGGIFLGGILWFANQYVIPKANVIHTTFKATYIDGNSSYEAIQAGKRTRDHYFKVDSFTYAGIRNYDTSSKQGNPFFMSSIKGVQVLQNTRADYIMWDTAKRKWKLLNKVTHTFNGLKETVETKPEEFMNFNFRPFDLKTDEYAKTKLTTPELDEFIKLEKVRGSEGLKDLEVERYKRDASAFAVLILTLIGAIVAGRKVRGGSGVHLAFGFTSAAIFILSDRFSTIFATKGNLPPLLAAWIPNILFCFVAYYLYRKAPK